MRQSRSSPGGNDRRKRHLLGPCTAGGQLHLGSHLNLPHTRTQNFEPAIEYLRSQRDRILDKSDFARVLDHAKAFDDGRRIFQAYPGGHYLAETLSLGDGEMIGLESDR